MESTENLAWIIHTTDNVFYWFVMVLLVMCATKDSPPCCQQMKFALHLYTILDSMYTFIRSAQILNTEH